MAMATPKKSYYLQQGNFKNFQKIFIKNFQKFFKNFFQETFQKKESIDILQMPKQK
jgi:hypothetical protein